MEDEAKIAAELEEKRRVEDALRPMSMDIDDAPEDGELTKNNSSVIRPVTEGLENEAAAA